MKRILQLFVTRWLSRTPFGLVVLGIGWWIMRKKRRNQEVTRADLREPGRKQGSPYAWHGPSSTNRR
ncbi:DUF6203 family protein [Planotetraspora sp. A-T 1434]|uniref:DUF6203 family protein n=1 Tax=Planotetraspora sp. A-T 1434 TaxID=2979219 RepID=UPI0021C200D4|nr:DUF6203 family protein [Planotetraspora sp. A-T 1434]MCT9931048.1 DUF6203 family protein [Planotetraspora sp. A-T 1434]